MATKYDQKIDHGNASQRQKLPQIHKYKIPTTNSDDRHFHDHGHRTLSWSAPRSIRRPPKANRKLNKALKNVMIDRSLNVAHLMVAEGQQIHVDTASSHFPIFLPSLKVFSWHADPSYANYNEDDENYEDDDHNDDNSSYHLHYNPQQHQHHQEFEEEKLQSVYNILEAAPNLELINDFHFETDYAVVMATNKVHCVQHLCLFDTVNVDHLLDFLGVGRPCPKILQLINHPNSDDDEDLKLEPEESEKLADTIEKLFSLIYDTIEVLDLSQFCSSVDLRIPYQCPQLYQLKIGSPVGQVQRPCRVLPPNLDLGEKFPNLRILDCSGLLTDEETNWEKYFPAFATDDENFEKKLVSVKTIVVTDRCSHGWMENLKKLCPHFTKLVLQTCYQDGGRWMNLMMFKIFQYWKHLEYFELRLDDFPTTECLSWTIDSAILGLTEDTTQSLRMAAAAANELKCCQCQIKEEQEAEAVTWQPLHCSITCLEKLRKLDIIFEHDSLGKLATRQPAVFGPLQPPPNEGAEQRPLLLSTISCRHGFSHMPRLKVDLIFDQNCPWGKVIRKQLDSLKCPIVSLRHRDDGCCSLRSPHYRHLAGVGSGGEMGIRIYGYP